MRVCRLEALTTEMEASKIAVVRALAERPGETLTQYVEGYRVPETKFEVLYNAIGDRCGGGEAPPDYCELFQ